MNTIRTISNVSFNSVEFFESKIRELTSPGKGQVLDWAHWIVHQPDTDQSKAHIHFVCKPSRRIDTNELRQQFLEPITDTEFIQAELAKGQKPEDILKPRGVLPFQITTSMTDWLLYAVHDVKYLYKKGQNRKTHYKREDVKSTDPEFLNTQWEETNDPLQALTERVVQMYTIEQMSMAEIMRTGMIAPNQVYYFRTLLESIDGPVVRKSKWNEPTI